MADLVKGVSYIRLFLMIDNTDHIQGATGRTPVVTLSKGGAPFAAAEGVVAEVSSGIYKIVLSATDTDTVGELGVHAAAPGCDPTDFIDQVKMIDSADGIETGINFKQAIQMILASVQGTVSGYPVGPGIFMAPDGTTIRLTIISDDYGNRTSVIRTPSTS